MPRTYLDQATQNIINDLRTLSTKIENAVLDAVQALKDHDLENALRIRKEDSQINKMRFEIENACMITIATQQPILATDLRLFASILEVVSELERMGDYAKGIALICLKIGHQKHIKPIIDLPRMAALSASMLHRALDAFIEHDAEAARQIPLEDDQVDELYQQVYRELVAVMLVDPSTIDQANLLMWAAHNLERMADRVTNICERAIFVATGEIRELDVSDDEDRARKP